MSRGQSVEVDPGDGGEDGRLEVDQDTDSTANQEVEEHAGYEIASGSEAFMHSRTTKLPSKRKMCDNIRDQVKKIKDLPMKRRVKRQWTEEEVAAVKRHLSACLTLNKVPQKHEAELCLAAEPLLRKKIAHGRISNTLCITGFS